MVLSCSYFVAYLTSTSAEFLIKLEWVSSRQLEISHPLEWEIGCGCTNRNIVQANTILNESARRKLLQELASNLRKIVYFGKSTPPLNKLFHCLVFHQISNGRRFVHSTLLNRHKTSQIFLLSGYIRLKRITDIDHIKG